MTWQTDSKPLCRHDATAASDIAMAIDSKNLTVGVIGPAGFGGSYVCIELINRGHSVVGISRRPEKIGHHERYIPRVADVSSQSIEELAQAFAGLDVLVNEYGPHSAGHEALQYSEYRWRPSSCNTWLTSCSAFPRGDSQDCLGSTSRQSPLLYHGRRLWKSVHAKQRISECPREQGVVDVVSSRYCRQRSSYVLHGRAAWSDGLRTASIP